MFDQSDLPDTPLPFFSAWMDAAREQMRYPGAMCLSSLSPDGYPEGRIVLLHQFDATGFFFMTDVRSDKGRALEVFPRAALTLYWEPLERQVRIQGEVEPGSEADADQFFAERPRRSRATAWASAQSRVLAERAALDREMAHFDAQFRDTDPIPRPPHWQAYRLVPRSIEFWQAGARRLHERLRYVRSGDGWRKEMLAP